jgi:hypothetical protein
MIQQNLRKAELLIVYIISRDYPGHSASTEILWESPCRGIKTSYKLDFIHLHINKMQGKLCLYSAKRKDRADLAKRIYHDP